MMKSNESHAYEETHGAASDGGECKEMYGAASDGGEGKEMFDAVSDGGERKEMFDAGSDGGERKEMFDAASDGGDCEEMTYDVELASEIFKCRYREYYGASTHVAVRPFADERFIDCFIVYHKLDILRWNILTLAGEKLHAVRGEEEKQGDESIVYQLERLDDGADLDKMVCWSMDELLFFYNQKRLTKQDVDKFQRLIEKARQEFRLIEYLATADFIVHDSSVESVIERVPEDMITSIGYVDVKGFVERYIWILKDWKATRLYYDFKLFLTECQWMTSNTRVFWDLCDIKKVTEDPTFLERGFHMIPDKEVSHVFWIYVAIVCTLQPMETVEAFEKNIEERKNDYINRTYKEIEHARLSFDKLRKSYPAQFTEPIHFLVFKEREEKYTIQHPVVEIAKIRAFFHDLPLDFYEKKHMYHKEENAAQIFAPSTLLGQGSGIRKMETKRQKISGDTS